MKIENSTLLPRLFNFSYVYYNLKYVTDISRVFSKQFIYDLNIVIGFSTISLGRGMNIIFKSSKEKRMLRKRGYFS
jgi:hypothetical protein